jgi:hypothetical protein
MRENIQSKSSCEAYRSSFEPWAITKNISTQFCASMWSPEECSMVERDARSVVPDVVFYAIPQGLQVREGPDGVVKHLMQHLPALLGYAHPGS